MRAPGDARRPGFSCHSTMPLPFHASSLHSSARVLCNPAFGGAQGRLEDRAAAGKGADGQRRTAVALLSNDGVLLAKVCLCVNARWLCKATACQPASGENGPALRLRAPRLRSCCRRRTAACGPSRGRSCRCLPRAVAVAAAAAGLRPEAWRSWRRACWPWWRPRSTRSTARRRSTTRRTRTAPQG
jgi:hypothetical protein